MPISRHGLSSATIGNNIYLIGGGATPGFSFSAISEEYHNTTIPEFGSIAGLILALSLLTIIGLNTTKSSILKN